MVLKDESGQGLTEYALIIALIALAAVAAITTFGQGLSNYFGDITNTVGNL